MNRILITLCFVVISIGLWAQDAATQDTIGADTVWKTGGVLGLNFSQTYLEHWQGGGQTSINGASLITLFANYKKGKWSWENNFTGAYGITRIGDGGQIQKTDDRLEINSKVGRETNIKSVFWSALLTFRTQWDAGYDYTQNPSPLISDPFAPAYILIGVGMDYKPSAAFSLYLSPATAKITIVDNPRLADSGAYGVTPAEFDTNGVKLSDGEMVRYEFGGFLKIQYTRDIMTNVNLTTRLDLFSNYLENPQNIDVNWETLVTMKINKVLSASLTTHLIYDHDIKVALDRNDDGVTDGSGPRTQFKEVFALGLQYQF